MSKKNRYTVPSEGMIRNAWTSVALSSGLLVAIGSWTLTDRIGAGKLTGTLPDENGTYLAAPDGKVRKFMNAGDLITYFRRMK